MVTHQESGLFAMVKIPHAERDSHTVQLRALKELCPTPIGTKEMICYIESPPPLRAPLTSTSSIILTSESENSNGGVSYKCPLTVFFGRDARSISSTSPLEAYIGTLTIDEHPGWCKVYAIGAGVEPARDPEGRIVPWYLNSEFELPSPTLEGTSNKRVTLSVQRCALKEGTVLGSGQLLPSDVEDTQEIWTVFTFYYATREQLDILGVLPDALSSRTGLRVHDSQSASIEFLRNSNMSLLWLLSPAQLYSFIRNMLDSAMLVNVPEASFNELVIALRRVATDTLAQLQREEQEHNRAHARRHRDSFSSWTSASSDLGTPMSKRSTNQGWSPVHRHFDSPYTGGDPIKASYVPPTRSTDIPQVLPQDPASIFSVRSNAQANAEFTPSRRSGTTYATSTIAMHVDSPKSASNEEVRPLLPRVKFVLSDSGRANLVTTPDSGSEKGRKPSPGVEGRSDPRVAQGQENA
ncbi:BZ3500_MvSof-1268-A1-R1_Chr1-3g02392 [Microbotryum saponariae]|uniref:BZ3500_MvSof-1268-A1-R1_Chr1-3g02392 protein n=1 Tax=Microbotryum saponariae TaxID=289078 RepID=A0A2X0KQI1_9BASI|nr:BZ3500_MvSof-1268-A1-R1_Chr1-3g02392 [Microbotryum saponariae]SCZ96179.1 BZ3501_MvSof-1269-A2-R1_Chr1-3g01995 [Microbotryum saponariae]